MISYKQNLLVFGGTNGSKTLNDMWLFDSKNKAWQQIEAKDTPEVIFPSLSLEEDTL